MTPTKEELREALAICELGRWELARREFREFLKHVKIFEPPPGRGTIAFEFWPHLEEMIEALPKERLVVWLKARRNGASWLIASYIVFKAQKRGSYFPLASQGEVEAIELLSKVRHVWNNLPEELKWGPLTTGSRTELKWGEGGSHIQAMPSTGNASRGSAITVGVIDEADFHEYLAAFYYAVKPSVDESGGQLIIVSTSNHETLRSFFKDLFQLAPANGFRPFFHGWRARIERTQEWYEARRREYPDAVRFEKEFPETAEQALAPPETIAAFDRRVLDSMRLDCREPVEKIGVRRVWQKAYTGKKYIAATDTSHGVGQDDAVTGVMDVATGYIVADIQSSVLNSEALAAQSVELLKGYGEPLWVIEDNDWGRVTIEKAKDLGYKRLYYRSEGKPGFHTNEGNRRNLWDNLIEAVAKRQITIPALSGLVQFYSIIRNPVKEGRIEAQQGGKDDYPMMVALLWEFRHRAFTAHVAGSDPLDVFGRSRQPGVGLIRW